MNIGTIGELLGLFKQWTDLEKSTVPKVTEHVVKPKFVPQKDFVKLPLSTPEAEGVPSALLWELLDRLKNDRTLDMHSVIVIRHGKIILDAAFGCHSTVVWKQTFSACKSIVSLAVGYALSEGLLSLDEYVIDVFGEYANAVSRRSMKDITLENLLTMTSTVDFNEAESAVSGEWIRSFMTSATTGKAGETFNYNSLNTYMLAAAVVLRSGVSLTEYLTTRLFEPLGITNIFWEKSPDGIEKGGWGLYITPHDMAKIGQCFLDGGMWNGKRIIPLEWVESAASVKAEAPEDYGAFNYGYQMWCGRDRDTFLFNGMLGQNVLGFRDLDLLIVTNAGNNEMFQQSSYFSTALELFNENSLSDVPIPENKEEYSALEKYVKSLKWDTPSEFPLLKCQALDGVCLVPENPAPAVGVMPLVLQVERNNYTKGLRELSFKLNEGRFYVVYKEADAIHRLPVGFGKPLLCNMSFRGDVFRVSTKGEFAVNEDGIDVLKLNIAFVETPCTVNIKIFFDRDEITLLQKEIPGEAFCRDFAKSIKKAFEDIKVVGGAALLVEDDYLDYKIEKTFSPKIKLKYKE